MAKKQYDDVFSSGEEEQLAYSSTERRNGRKAYSIIIVLLVCMSLLLSTVTLALFSLRQKNGSGSAADPKNCLPCSNVDPGISSSKEVQNLYKSLHQETSKDTGEKKCCAETQDQEIAMAKLTLMRLSNKTAREAPSKAAKTTGNHQLLASPLLGPNSPFMQSVAFAQKSLIYPKTLSLSRNIKISEKATSLMKINPNRTKELYEIVRGVDLTYNGIRIKYPGLYFVYKSIHFFPDEAVPCKRFGSNKFESILIKKNRNNQESILVRTVHTCCPDCISDSETGFVGAVFQLDKDDVIQVNVSSAAIVHIGKDVTFVGLMMMGGQSNV